MAFRSGTNWDTQNGSSSSPSWFWLIFKLASLHMASLGLHHWSLCLVISLPPLPQTLHFAFLLSFPFTFLSPHHPYCTAPPFLCTQPQWPLWLSQVLEAEHKSTDSVLRPRWEKAHGMLCFCAWVTHHFSIPFTYRFNLIFLLSWIKLYYVYLHF